MHEPHFSGHLSVVPPLNEAELDFLDAAVETTMDVPGASVGPDSSTPPTLRDGPAGGVPWSACRQGCCLVIDYPEGTSLTSARRWLSFLLRRLLGPGATLSTSVLAPPGFTFDHVLEGAVVAHDRGSGEVVALRVTANRVEQVRLCGPRPGCQGGAADQDDPQDRPAGRTPVRHRDRSLPAPEDGTAPPVATNDDLGLPAPAGGRSDAAVIDLARRRAARATASGPGGRTEV